jgi:protein-disulfide isomerase
MAGSNKNKKSNIIAVLIPIIVVIAVVVTVVVINANNKSSNNSGDNSATSPNSSQPSTNQSVAPTKYIQNEGISVDKALGIKLKSDAVTLDLYYDYICPFCGMYERQYGPSMNTLVQSGELNLVMHPLALMDQMSQGTQYSSRASSAIYYISQKDPEHLWDFHMGLFAEGVQPDEGSTGLTDEQIASVAIKAGVNSKVASALQTHYYQQYDLSATQNVNDNLSNFSGTPDMRLTYKGKTVQWSGWKPNVSNKEAMNLLYSAISNMRKGEDPNG